MFIVLENRGGQRIKKEWRWFKLVVTVREGLRYYFWLRKHPGKLTRQRCRAWVRNHPVHGTFCPCAGCNGEAAAADRLP